MCKESNEDDTKKTQKNKPRALTSLQLVYSCVFTCFRFASTLNMLLCLLFCCVSLIQSSSVFPHIHFSPVCEFIVIVHGSFEVLSSQDQNNSTWKTMSVTNAVVVRLVAPSGSEREFSPPRSQVYVFPA